MIHTIRQLPKHAEDYNGLTIVLSNPSRNDLESGGKLLSGAAGWLLEHECFNQKIRLVDSDCRTASTKPEGLLPETKHILLLGTKAFQTWTKPGVYSEYHLDEQRGCPLQYEEQGRPLHCISSYLPQDALDVVNWEKIHNPLLSGATTSNNEVYGEDNSFTESILNKRKTSTARRNYRFWLERDCQKLLQPPAALPPSTYHIYPSVEELTYVLTNPTHSPHFYLDIETASEFNITCLSFAFTPEDIYTVPIIRYDYTIAYSNYVRIFKGLVSCLNTCTTVCHNAMFDLFILAWKYKLPIGRRVYDTMLAHHRCWPEAEKSLGHAMSHLTNEPYHKDEGIWEPKNKLQERQLWAYNAKDVRGMIGVHRELERHAAKDMGIMASIKQANEMVRPYIIVTLTGIRFVEDKRAAKLAENDTLMNKYLWIIRYLIGDDYYKACQGKSVAPLPLSNKQMCKYFHEMLGYEVIRKSEKTGKPSLDAKSLLKLKLKYPDNAVIDFVLAFRERAKETGSLKFTPWDGELIHDND